MTKRTLIFTRVRNLPHCPWAVLTMTGQSRQQKKRDGVALSLDIAISMVNIGKEASSMTPAPAVFSTAAILLTTIPVCLPFLHQEMFQTHG